MLLRNLTTITKKQFPFNAPLIPNDVKKITIRDLMDLSDEPYNFYSFKPMQPTSKLSIEDQLVSFYELICYPNNSLKELMEVDQVNIFILISYLVIAINTCITYYMLFPKNPKTNITVVSPVYTMLSIYFHLEELISPKVKCSSFTQEDQKYLMQNNLQRIFHCLSKYEVSPNNLNKELLKYQQNMLSLSLYHSDIDLLSSFTTIETREHKISSEHIKDKRERIVLTYCKFFTKRLLNLYTPIEATKYFKNITGNSVAPVMINDSVIIENLAVYPTFFFNSKYYKEEILPKLNAYN